LLILGAGDYQFDVYRMMKEYNGQCWEDYRPFTNVMVRTVFVLVVLHTHAKTSVASLPHAETTAFKATETSWYEKENCGCAYSSGILDRL
jgi:serine/threonine-protein kinase haspin